MRIKLILIFFSFLMAAQLQAADTSKIQQEEFQILVEFADSVGDNATPNVEVKFKRGKAILFTVLTGLFGGHRIYFGTKPRTPILYSVTLGGLGILPLIDLVHIIFTKDLSKYEHKSQVIMWGN